jgi:hypothetical protein
MVTKALKAEKLCEDLTPFLSYVISWAQKLSEDC